MYLYCNVIQAEFKSQMSWFRAPSSAAIFLLYLMQTSSMNGLEHIWLKCNSIQHLQRKETCIEFGKYVDVYMADMQSLYFL